MSAPSTYRVERISRARALVLDFLWAAEHKHTVHGLVEVDVTRARRAIAERRARTGEETSLTAWVATCVGAAAAHHPEVRSLRVGGRQVVFDRADVSVVLERAVGDRLVPMPFVVRSADLKSLARVQAELREALARPVSNPGGLAGYGWVARLPVLVRRALLRVAGRSVTLLTRIMPPITVTSIGAAAGKGASWGLPIVSVTLAVTIGGLVDRPVLVDGRLENRDHLCLTISVDHDLVDGSPAARFMARLRGLLEADPFAASGTQAQ